MKQIAFVSVSMFIAAALALTGCSGCGGGDKAKKTETSDGGGKTTPETSEKPKKAIPGGDGVIKGTIVLSGGLPDSATKPLTQIITHTDCKKCFENVKEYLNCDQTWIAPEKKGVANVLVKLKVPDNTYFEPVEKDKNRTDEVEMDNVCCAFKPHVVVLYPSYFDGKGLKRSGQKFRVKNAATFDHNFKYAGDTRKDNQGDYKLAKGEEKEIKLNPQNGPIPVECSIHTWMKAKIFVLDYPYADVTNEKGEFTLKNLPTGTKLTVEFWHEAGSISPMDVTVTAGKETNLGDISISAK